MLFYRWQLSISSVYKCIDPAAFWAYLYLQVYEADFISPLIKTGKPRAAKFKNASHFIEN